MPPRGQTGNTAPGALLGATDGTPDDLTIENDQFNLWKCRNNHDTFDLIVLLLLEVGICIEYIKNVLKIRP